MCASWSIGKERYDPGLPQLLAERFENIRTDEGFQGFAHQEYVTVLQSIVDFSSSVPSSVRRGIVYRATFSAAESGKVTANALIREMSKLENEYEKRAKDRFVLATSISVKDLAALSKTEISGCRITFNRYLPAKFDPAAIADMAEEYIIGNLPTRYSVARVSVQARSEDEAFERALDAVDLLRGVWNLYFNRRSLLRSSSGRRKPVNEILLGPVHTLHRPHGKLVSDRAFWYEEDYVGPVQSQGLANSWPLLKKFERRIRRKLTQHNYRQDVEDAIRRYGRALDSRDWNTAFLRLWSLLETLTSTLENDSHKTTVKRALFLQRDRRYHGQVLNHLRNNRNKAVHLGQEAAEVETLLYQVKRYVEALLLFHIFNIYNFSTIKDSARFLDLPPDVSELQAVIRTLEEKVRLAKYAVKFDSL